ncbi:MAG: hypothetical protein Kow00109_14000 [Acidobacteriota bacterium]
MCVCGCSNMIVAKCSCGKAAEMTAEVQRLLESGATKEAVLTAFEEKYGSWVLAAPKAEGFNWAAWILPFVALALGSVIVAVVYRNLRGSTLAPPPGDSATPPTPGDSEAIDHRKRLEEKLRC